MTPDVEKTTQRNIIDLSIDLDYCTTYFGSYYYILCIFSKGINSIIDFTLNFMYFKMQNIPIPTLLKAPDTIHTQVCKGHSYRGLLLI